VTPHLQRRAALAVLFPSSISRPCVRVVAHSFVFDLSHLHVLVLRTPKTTGTDRYTELAMDNDSYLLDPQQDKSWVRDGAKC